MGTIHDQPPRRTYDGTPNDRPGGNGCDVRGYIQKLKRLAAAEKIDFSDVATAMVAYELSRANSIAIDDGDVRDEQASGIAHALDGIAAQLGTIDSTIDAASS